MAEIDWENLRHRLEDSRKAFEAGFAPDEEQQRRILRTRAQVLARKPENKLPATRSLQVVDFLLAHEHYGVELTCIREVYPLKELQTLPSTPAFVVGLINVRGEILSVLNIKKFFGLPEKGITDLNKVLIVRSGQMEVGILADVILSVRSIAAEELSPALPTLTGIRADYIKGITKDALVILEIDKILSDKRILVDEG